MQKQNYKKSSKAVVLLSGGVDSATCLARAVEAFGKRNVFALIAWYGQRHKREIESARKLSELYDVESAEVDLTEVFGLSSCSLLEKNNVDVENGDYADQIKRAGGKPVATYVPFRNGLFLSAAASLALSVGADTIVYGAHMDDAAGNAYPDCSEDFVEKMNAAVAAGTGGQVRVWAPYVHSNKAKIVADGLRLGVPYEVTWSCYKGGDRACGKCGTCIDRLKAFKANGAVDPIEYEEQR